MKKFWIVYSHVNSGSFTRFDSYQDAEDEAKRLASVKDYEVFILEAVASTKRPVPAIDVIKL